MVKRTMHRRRDAAITQQSPPIGAWALWWVEAELTYHVQLFTADGFVLGRRATEAEIERWIIGGRKPVPPTGP